MTAEIWIIKKKFNLKIAKILNYYCRTSQIAQANTNTSKIFILKKWYLLQICFGYLYEIFYKKKIQNRGDFQSLLISLSTSLGHWLAECNDRDNWSSKLRVKGQHHELPFVLSKWICFCPTCNILFDPSGKKSVPSF